MPRMAETTHFLAGSPLNRLSWLRSSSKFLNMALQLSETRWTVFQAGRPLIVQSANGGPRSLALLKTDKVKQFLEEEPYFGQGRTSGESITSDSPALKTCRLRGATIVFLGLKEPDGLKALPSSEFRTPENPQDIRGAPYFSIELAQLSQTETEGFIKANTRDGEILQFLAEPRTATATFSMFEAAVFAEARTMLDWNIRNKFCAACGSPTLSLWGGWKLSCSSLLPWMNNEGKEPCPSNKGLHNFAHPRTDPVVIMAVIDDAGDQILLGRNKMFPPGLYSTLAGFCEPAESFEDAVKREIWEESGIRVHDVHYHSSQPWPYPANIMVGCYAFADSSQTIRTDLDNELVEARWFTREEVACVLAHPQGTNFRVSETKQSDNDTERASSSSVEDQPLFRVPPRTAIAGVLISDWVAGIYGRSPTVKGNL